MINLISWRLPRPNEEDKIWANVFLRNCLLLLIIINYKLTQKTSLKNKSCHVTIEWFTFDLNFKIFIFTKMIEHRELYKSVMHTF